MLFFVELYQHVFFLTFKMLHCLAFLDSVLMYLDAANFYYCHYLTYHLFSTKINALQCNKNKYVKYMHSSVMCTHLLRFCKGICGESSLYMTKIKAQILKYS